MDSLNVEIYELKGQLYRRNVPFELINHSNPAADAKIGEDLSGEDSDTFIEPLPIGLEASTINETMSNSEDEKEKEVVIEQVELKDYNIQFDSKKKVYFSSIPIPNSFCKFLIGAKGARIQKLQQTTNCKIKINNSTSVVDIDAPLMSNVRQCRDEIDLILIEARRKTSATHFVSIPLGNNLKLQESYNVFLEKLREDKDIPEACKDESILRPVEKLHLTVSVLKLFTQQDENLAKKCINELFQREIKKLLPVQTKIPLKFAGLDYFSHRNKNVKSVNVIYAKVVSEKLQKIADLIDDSLTKIGLAEKRDTPSVKLHLTLINTKNAKSTEKFKTIDATEFLKKYGNYNFVQIDAEQLQICLMHSTDPYTKGYPAIYAIDL